MEPPLPTTVSTCTSETARGKHVFNIAGGYDWCVRYYPDGNSSQECKGYVSVYLDLLTKNVEVRADYTFRLIESGGPQRVICHFANNYNSVDPSDKLVSYGTNRFMKQSELEIESSPYLRDDRLVIECEVKVIKRPQVPHLGKLLDGKRGADVTFEVKGEVFSAHKIMLATRSPVFDAQLYGSMSDAGATSRSIIVQDMEPPVFKAFLHFIYTDSFPAMDDLDNAENQEMVKHLLVAADRYAMDRMKTICEGILCKSLDVETVATTLALADQHHCSKLKDACVEFIISSNRMDDVVASQGYAQLKRSCPAVMLDVFEKAIMSRKNLLC